MKGQKNLTAKYFNEISDGYKNKYSPSQELHKYIFSNRLNIALTQRKELEGVVLDIGAGSGALYTELKKRGIEVDYIGCDISEGMLKASGIPQKRQYVGSCYEIKEFAGIKLDAVFMLGVTTYMDRAELERNLDYVSNSLYKRGVFIVSFTNSMSINRRMRALIKYGYKMIKGSRGKGVISQDFQTYAYKESELIPLLASRFDSLEPAVYYNFIFFPVSHLFKRFSIRLSKLISRYAPRAIKEYTAAEFILVCKSKN